MNHQKTALAAVVCCAAMAWAPQSADAFCGFYVGGADAKLFNNATMTVMMRDGKRTVLSMQNNYQGPPSDFAMVIPVPVVLKKENVKTLDQAIFDKVDQMAAPRLVEYWEKDPCAPDIDMIAESAAAPGGLGMVGSGAGGGGAVKIEAQFKVGEYDIVVLSANDSGALDKWLKTNKYNIPDGAEPVLRPYVEAGTKFFVAKVDAKKVKFKDNKAVLSPLRFYYDSDTFSLPVRLGLLNANGPQDLIVHILARGQRYEMANFPNATIPTNIGVGEDAKGKFGEFYAALFDRTLKKNKGAVITEYAWDASTCDPCPGPNLTGQDFLTLGADVIDGKPQYGFVLTRLHARYTKEELKEDLVFKAAGPIVGGREWYGPNKELEQASKPGGVNNFQGRYIIRHPWTGEIKCENPVRGRWGGPPGNFDARPAPAAARDLADAPRGAMTLENVVRQDIPEIDLKQAGGGASKPAEDDKKEAPEPAKPGAESKEAPAGGEGGASPEDDEGCAVASHHRSGGNLWAAQGLLGLLVMVRRKKNRRAA